MKTTGKNASLVYSTDRGKMCPTCRRAVTQCTCARKQPASPADGVVRVSRETKGRKGKGVTLIRGLALAPDALALLGKQLKIACGSGGTVKDGTIEVQGDHSEKVIDALRKLGYIVKCAGG